MRRVRIVRPVAAVFSSCIGLVPPPTGRDRQAATPDDSDAARTPPPGLSGRAASPTVLIRLIGGDSGVNHEEIGFWRQRTRLVNVVLELVERLSETSAADARDNLERELLAAVRAVREHDENEWPYRSYRQSTHVAAVP